MIELSERFQKAWRQSVLDQLQNPYPGQLIPLVKPVVVKWAYWAGLWDNRRLLYGRALDFDDYGCPLDWRQV